MIKKEEFKKELKAHKTFENYCKNQFNENKKMMSNFSLFLKL